MEIRLIVITLTLLQLFSIFIPYSTFENKGWGPAGPLNSVGRVRHYSGFKNFLFFKGFKKTHTPGDLLMDHLFGFLIPLIHHLPHPVRIEIKGGGD